MSAAVSEPGADEGHTVAEAPGAPSSAGRGRAALLLGGSAALLALALLFGPSVTRSQLDGALLERVVRDLHLPRALFGAVAGFGLALAGVVLQSVLRNPLASPYTLGISSGAAVGAVIALQVGGATGLLGLSAPAAGAFAGAALTAMLVFTLASLRSFAAETLLLAGVAVSLFGGAVISMLHYLADTIDLLAMVRWSLGGLEVVGYGKVAAAAACVALGSAILLVGVGRQLDVASLDDDSARGLGVDPARVRRTAFLGTSVITAGIVAFAGPIGFVGLVVPHAVRYFTGPDPRLLLPCAALTGGAFLIACDVVARTALYPTNLPINVVTYAIGCPAFVWILVRRSEPS